MKKYSFIAGVVVLAVAILACSNSSSKLSNEDSTVAEVQTSAEALAVNTSPENSNAADEPVSTELKWYGFEEGYAKSVKEGKILLVDAYTDWCGWCKVMDKKTYTDPGVIKELNTYFVCVKFNPEIAKEFAFANRKMQAPELLQYLGNGQVTGFPATIFWPNVGKDEARYVQPGFLPPADFLQLLGLAREKKS